MAERITINQLAERVDIGFQVVKEAIEDLKTNQVNFSRNDVLELKFKELDIRIAELNSKDKELELKIDKLKQSSSLQVWVTGSLSAVLGSVLTFLVVYFLNNVRS